jgi:hypothetical protein
MYWACTALYLNRSEITMRQMFNQICTAITVLFAAAEAVAKTLFHLATTGEKYAESYAEEASSELEASKRKRLEALSASDATMARLAAPEYAPSNHAA